MQAGDDQLGCDEEQNYSGDPEELLQIDAYATFDEHHAKDDRHDHARQGAQETEQFGRVQGYSSQDQDGFNPFSQDHQKYEEEEAESGVAASQEADFAFNLPFKAAAR